MAEEREERSPFNGGVSWTTFVMTIVGAVIVTFLGTTAAMGRTFQRMEDHMSNIQVHESPNVKEARIRRILDDKMDVLLVEIKHINEKLDTLEQEAKR